MVPQDLLDLLACPVCRTALTYRLQPESLKCANCGRVYPVRDDIPILLIDEAKIETA
jgi:LSD1 subclass zinc finger protein